jgi:anti-anti-sigma regulatory factor
MTAGLWNQDMEVLAEGAREVRPAVSIVWTLGREAKPPEAWLELYDGPAGRSAVFALAGALGNGSLERFEEALAQTLGWGIRQVVLDFSRVTHLDYRRLPQLVAWLRARGEEGVAFAIVGLNRYLSDLFRVAGVEVDLESPAGAYAVCGAAAAPEAALEGAAAGDSEIRAPGESRNVE